MMEATISEKKENKNFKEGKRDLFLHFERVARGRKKHTSADVIPRVTAPQTDRSFHTAQDSPDSSESCISISFMRAEKNSRNSFFVDSAKEQAHPTSALLLPGA